MVQRAGLYHEASESSRAVHLPLRLVNRDQALSLHVTLCYHDGNF